MLTRLRHHQFIRSDDEHHQVDAANTGKHVFYESFMAGNVDETDCCVGGQRQVREADIDRDPAFLFFFQTVGVNSSKSLDERRFAVIDVSGGAYDNVRHRSSCTKGSGSPTTLK